MSGCLFCDMHRPADVFLGTDGRISSPVYLPENICEAHQAATGIEPYLAAHPNGEHTPTCGCVGLEELKRQIGVDR